MTFGEALRTALADLGRHRLRSALTTLGVVFGVGAVIAMLSIGAGAEREAQAMIERLGLANVLVRAKATPPEELIRLREKSLGVSLRDAEAIADAVSGVTAVAPKVEIAARSLTAAGVKAEAAVYGVPALYAGLLELELAEGRFIDPLDEREHAQVCVLGEGTRRRLFGLRPALGELVKVDDVWLRVVGVAAGSGGEGQTFEGVPLGSTSDVLYLPLATALRKFDRDPLAAPLAEIVVHLETASRGRGAARAIDGLLQRLHGGVDDYELVVPEALLAQSRRTQRLFNLVMGAIASISLLVGGIGIMNIMLASVLERTREIGIRRAVGARRKDVMFQFLVESFTISALGGLVGILFGLAVSRLIAASAGWPTVVQPWSILLATLVALAVGLASGLYPARRAARLDPIEALRYE